MHHVDALVYMFKLSRLCGLWVLAQPVEESFSVEVFPFIYWLQVYWRRIQGLFFYDFNWLLGQSSLWDYFFFFVFFLVFVFFASFIISLSFTLLSFFSFDFFWSLAVFNII